MTAVQPRTITTKWELRTHDVLGNEDDGWEVNDSYIIDREYEIVLVVETVNPGKESEFFCAEPTEEQVRKAYRGIRGKLNIDGDDVHLDIDMKDGYPVGAMHCVSHKCLSPLPLDALDPLPQGIFALPEVK